MSLRIGIASIVSAAIAASALWAQGQDVIVPAAFVFNGKQHNITQSATVDTVRVSQHYQRAIDCGGICLAPMTVSAMIPTVGERDVIAFVSTDVAAGQGLLLDSRSQADRATGYIAGSINVPVALLASDNPYLADILIAMGAKRSGDQMDFTSALPLVVYDDGPTTFDAPQLIEALRDAGYPETKIKYYRGGLQVWTALGLSVEDA